MGMGIVGGSFQFGGGKGFSAAGRQEGLNGEKSLAKRRAPEEKANWPTELLNGVQPDGIAAIAIVFGIGTKTGTNRVEFYISRNGG